MTDKATLLALAERCEKATGPDRELEALISVAARPQNNARVIWMRGKRFFLSSGIGRVPFSVEGGKRTNFHITWKIVFYTSSLDAALTLAKGKRVILNIAEDDITTAIVDGTQAVGETPSLALTAACLRARAA